MPRLAVLAITSRPHKNLEVVANAKFCGNPNKNPENATFAKNSFWRWAEIEKTPGNGMKLTVDRRISNA